MDTPVKDHRFAINIASWILSVIHGNDALNPIVKKWLYTASTSMSIVRLTSYLTKQILWKDSVGAVDYWDLSIKI